MKYDYPNIMVYSLVIFGLVTYGFLLYMYMDFNSEIVLLTNRLNEKQSLEKIIFDFAKSKTYDINNYNCYDYSIDLIYELEQKGYVANLISGYHKEGTYIAKYKNNFSRTIEQDKLLSNEGYNGHAWLEVCSYIEATSGTIIDINNIINEVV